MIKFRNVVVGVKKDDLDSNGVDYSSIVHDVSFDLNLGENVLLMGPNGSGKSTLVRAILGDSNVKILSGDIILRKDGDGKKLSVNDLKPWERAQAGIFVGFQHPVVIPGVSFSDLLFFSYKKLFNNRKKDANDSPIDYEDFYNKVQDQCDFLGIEEKLINRTVNENLSGGEKKKMELLQMLILRPRYIVLDEPDSGLDTDSISMIKKALGRVSKDAAILIISHNPSDLLGDDFDRVMVMKKGVIVEKGSHQMIEEVMEKGYELI
jgi:Fe-S cluster assembly ATP-binding protein